MKATILKGPSPLRTFVLVCQTGDEAMESLLALARQERLGGCHFTAIGAFSSATVGYFDWQLKDYKRIEIAEQVEVLSLVGDIAVENDEPKIHAHVVLGKSDGSTAGGHLLQGWARPTLELVITDLPRRLHRTPDQQSGLALINLSGKSSRVRRSGSRGRQRGKPRVGR